MKSVTECTRKDFEALPLREWNDDIGEFDSLVILPTRRLHDSGYRCMDFIAVIKQEPIYRLSGCSDVIHINGIGGYGKWANRVPDLIPPIAWSIDCLRVSGLLQIFCGKKMIAGPALSSFDLFALTH